MGAFQLHAVSLAVQPPSLAKDGVAMRVGLAGQHGQQRAAKVGVLRFDAGQRLDGRGKVDQLDHGLADSGLDRGPRRRFDHKGDARQAVLKGVLGLFDQPIVAGEIAVVGKHKDRCVVIDACFSQGFHQQAVLVVDARAHPIVGRAQLGPAFLRPALQVLVLIDAL